MDKKKIYLILGALGVILVVFVFVLVLRGGGDKIGDADLEFWGVFDDSKFYNEIIRDFKRVNPGVNVRYRKFNFEDYEDQLLNALAAGTGPDVWLMHNTWLPKHKDKIFALPEKISGRDEPIMTTIEFKNTFVDVATQDLVSDGKIYGMPIYIDTLALYYNRDLLNTAGVAKVPSTWEELNTAVQKITKFDGNGRITQSAIAMGTADNINRASDILALLMLQTGLEIVENKNSGAELLRSLGAQNLGVVGLQYYTDFANPQKNNYTWNDQSDYSLDAFREGKTAMMLNYSHHFQTLQSQAPLFNFDVAAAPQIKDTNVFINYPNYWAPTVSKSSKYPIPAWDFVNYLASREGATKYVNTSLRPPARRDLIISLSNHDLLGVFANQALSAKSWYQVDNLAIEDIFVQMINDINFGRNSIVKALRAAENQINALLINQGGGGIF